jgi:DNA-binding HxlR family transcriptional regulator
VQDAEAPDGGCVERPLLSLLGERWTLQVIVALAAGPLRFTHLKRTIPGISQRMLTVRLRELERDGILTRTHYPVIPPRVEYALTRLGESLLEPIGALHGWVLDRGTEIDAARAAYDAR